MIKKNKHMLKKQSTRTREGATEESKVDIEAQWSLQMKFIDPTSEMTVDCVVRSNLAK